LFFSVSVSSILWGEEEREEEAELLVCGDRDTLVFQLRNLMFTYIIDIDKRVANT
jgi:hypothetical protein